VAWDAATALLAGGCLEVFWVSWATAMQQEIPPAKLSRLSSYDLFASFTLAPLGAVVAGPAANAFGTPAVLTAGGLLIVLLAIAVLFIPEIRRMRRRAYAHPGEADLPTP
jgi:hypothetical protein